MKICAHFDKLHICIRMVAKVLKTVTVGEVLFGDNGTLYWNERKH